MIDVTVVGSTTADLGSSLPNYYLHSSPQSQSAISLPFGSKLPVESYQLTSGGSGANVAVGLQKAGVASRLISSVGNDPIGQFLADSLKETDVELDLDYATELTNVSIVLRVKAERTILTSHNQPYAFLDRPLPSTSWLHIGPLPANKEKFYQELVSHCAQTSQPISLNPSLEMLEDRSRYLALLLQVTKIIFLNHQEAAVLARQPRRSSAPELIKAIRHLGPEIVCLTAGEKGAYVGAGEKTLFAPALADSLSRVDATGAGDAFTSGFLAGYLGEPLESEQLNLERALTFGVLNAASVVGHYGAQAGLLTALQLVQDQRTVTLKKVEN